MSTKIRALAGTAGVVALTSWSATALGCGGFFCSQSAPVNQAAERIIFSENGDGSVTAVIQILYEGPAENFSWLLPITTVPTPEQGIQLASDLAFTRLQSATNPTYRITTQVEGTCDPSRGPFPSAAVGGASAGGPGGGVVVSPDGGGVMVEASGSIGAFEWTAISLDRSLEDPAAAAVTWLEQNGYDVGEGAPGLIRPYLLDGLYLLALRLTKGADTGSIRPIALTYDATKPMIPIKLTAVAANEDMGVMTWLLSSARGVPQNYRSLELNEARIDWFNGATNYNEVVSAAADEAGGQGFVTEYASATTSLSAAVWSEADEAQWAAFLRAVFTSRLELLDYAASVWGSWDGFDDAVRAVALPRNVTYEEFRRCFSCYETQLTFTPEAFQSALDEQVMEPMRLVQKLIDSRPYVTRLYTTMSASDMTVDPLFTFNPDLDDVSNVHIATRTIECSPELALTEAPWRLSLPGGSVIRGKGAPTSWPTAVQSQPANARVTQLSSTGAGLVLEDNTRRIASSLEAYNRGQNSGSSSATSSSGCSVGIGAGAAVGWLGAATMLLGLGRRRARGQRMG